MNMTDPIADMLTRIRNGVQAHMDTVEVTPVSKVKVEIARILKAEDYVENYAVTGEGIDKKMTVTLKYTGEKRQWDRRREKQHPDRQHYAFKKQKNMYTDPYKNLYNLRNKKASANSTADGKVATVCSGMAGIVIALRRQLDIPAKLVNGHHISLSSPYCNWTTEEDIDKIDHWWAEVYVDGRWIVVDPTPGNSSKWKRTSFSGSGTWEYTGITNYIYFDPTPEQLATSHATYNIKSNKTK